MDHRDSAAAWETARAQLWLITLTQMLGFGFTVSSVRHRLREGRLWRVFPSVFAVGHPEMTPDRLALAAVLACGDGAALARIWAAAHWSVWEKQPPVRPQVVVPFDHGRPGPRGIDLKRSTTLLPSEITEHRAIPVTNLERTICDCAATLNAYGIKSMIRQAQRLHHLELSALHDYLADKPARSFRHARVRKVLAKYNPKSALTQTEREALFFDLCERRGLPLPEPQYDVGRYTCDFVWPEYRLIAEIDDSSHETDIAKHDDRIRDAYTRARGFATVRVLLTELLDVPDTALEPVERALRARMQAA